MKKIYKISLFLILCLIINITSVSASTNTRERSQDNYLVGDWVEVTDYNEGNILSTPAVDALEKVYDFADLYSEDEEKELYEDIKEFINKYDMDLAVVTTDNTTKTSREYADDFYDYNDFSQKGGVLFLINMVSREIYMTTTGSAIKMYNDNRINQALDSVYRYMGSQNYYDGTVKFIDEISNYASLGIPGKKKNSITHDLLMAMLISLVVTAIIISILIYKNKMVRKATTAKEYLNKESVKINKNGDILISSRTSKTAIDHSSSSSGGSSTHSGSSGASHGGGGHSF